VSDLPLVRLRPLVAADADPLEAGHTASADPFNWAGFRSPGWLHTSIADRTSISPTDGQLAVVDADDVLLGDVGYRFMQTGATAASFCWQIGVSLLSGHRGRGYGAAAQRELARYLFSTTTAVRVEADTEIDNLAEQRSLERAGFTREGVRRLSMWHDGSWRDTVVYAVVRGEL
jgi:RimJ/RimL family protein N-acetyltransferase